MTVQKSNLGRIKKRRGTYNIHAYRNKSIQLEQKYTKTNTVHQVKSTSEIEHPSINDSIPNISPTAQCKAVSNQNKISNIKTNENRLS
jgi:hypothetical protein